MHNCTFCLIREINPETCGRLVSQKNSMYLSMKEVELINQTLWYISAERLVKTKKEFILFRVGIILNFSFSTVHIVSAKLTYKWKNILKVLLFFEGFRFRSLSPVCRYTARARILDKLRNVILCVRRVSFARNSGIFFSFLFCIHCGLRSICMYFRIVILLTIYFLFQWYDATLQTAHRRRASTPSRYIHEVKKKKPTR